MGLNSADRTSLAQGILSSLQAAVPGSTAELKGSLADGSADIYSDIDIVWEIPDRYFQEATGQLLHTLVQVQPVESLRSSPEFQNSQKRRLYFVQFERVPLFWRADIEVFAESIGRDPEFDLENVSARGDEWSRTHSALMNAVAAIKALLRSNREMAGQILDRGFERVGCEVPGKFALEHILRLIRKVAEIDPQQANLASKIERLYFEEFDRLSLEPKGTER